MATEAEGDGSTLRLAPHLVRKPPARSRYPVASPPLAGDRTGPDTDEAPRMIQLSAAAAFAFCNAGCSSRR